MTKLDQLQQELSAAKEALDNTPVPRISHEDIEDVSDAYQTRLEYNWWAEEQRQLIRELEAEIKAILSNDPSCDDQGYFAGYYTADGRHTWDFEESIGE